MSQPELVRALQAARPVAPPALRERVRLVAARSAPPPHRLVTPRRVLAVAVPLAAAIAAGVIATRPAHRAAQPVPLAGKSVPAGAAVQGRAQAPSRAAPVAPSDTRLQRYTATLELRVRSAAAVSAATKRAVAIAASLGGHVSRVNVSTGSDAGRADLRLRVPKARVQDAVRRLSALGQIVGESVQVQDLQPGADATSRLIARLQRRLAVLHAEPSTPALARQVAALTARVQRLQRERAATARSARFATVALTLSTPERQPAAAPHHGPLHGLGTAFRWIGIGAVYALAIGVPLAALALLLRLGARALRRRREDALLSRP